MLTYEPGTLFTRKKERGEFREPADGEAQELFLLTRGFLEQAGYRQYEVSSFARSPLLESRHNKKYWEGAPYLGLGPSAHSFRDPERFWNIAAARQYIEALLAGASPVAGRETLSRSDRKLEALFLGLRTSRGIDLESFSEKFGEDLEAARRALVADLVKNDLASRQGTRLRLTPRGLAVADAIALKLARDQG
jgi:oxygen-independent coproporphyrinogen-3 oxidase